MDAVTIKLIHGSWLPCVLLAFGTVDRVGAEVKMPAIFGDHMILQRGKPVPVFGTGAAGEKVAVKFHGQEQKTTADARGVWQVK
ncbi:MAG: 9-O-acetylesterase, partial [Verrucomicrobiota bacterium]